MELTKGQFAQLQKALLDGFNREELRRMVYLGLGQILEHVASGETDPEVVFNLLRWAHRTDNITELMQAAANANPTSKALKKAARDCASSFAPEVAAKPHVPGLLPSVWNVPQRRNPNFVGREARLEHLHTAFGLGKPGSSVQVLTGLGGVGKTQTAVEYAYRYAGDYDVVWWMRAEEPTTLTSDFAQLAWSLGLPEAAEADQLKSQQAALRWLGSHKRWLLVLDNATEPAVVRNYLPDGDTGHVLITTRNPVGWGRLGAAQYVPVLSPSKAVEFLLHRSGEKDAVGAAKLAEELGYLPLALEQAGAYMEQSGKNAVEYLGLYRTRSRDLLSRGRPEGDYLDTVLTTWSLAFNAASKITGAGELLNLCAYLAPNDISLELISDGAAALPRKLAGVVANELARDDAIATVHRYSLIRVDDGRLNVHRLVQAVARDRLSRTRQKTWAGAAVRLVNAAFPQASDNVRTWGQCDALLPHALAAAEHAEVLGIEPGTVGRMLNQVGGYLWGRARYAEAKQAFERALALNEATLGPDHPDVATALSNLGNVLRDLGDLAGARKAIEQALAIDEAAFGPLHPNVAAVVNNLGNVLQDMGDLAGAKQDYERALAIDVAASGPDHPNSASYANNLGNVLRELGDLVGAKQALELALAFSEAALGPDHPDVATALSNLGNVLQDLGDLAGARKAIERAMAIDEAAFGPLHPNVAADINNLGNVLRAQGDLVGARRALERALAIREATFGPDHPNLAAAVNNLGNVLWDLGDLVGARGAFERALVFSEAALGPDHPDVATNVNNLGLVLRSEGDLVGARQAHERALAIYKASLGPHHPNVATAVNNMGLVLEDMGDLVGARQAYELALAIGEATFGPDHPKVASYANNLGNVLRAQGDLVGARTAVERALAICRRHLGDDHPLTETVRENLGAMAGSAENLPVSGDSGDSCMSASDVDALR